MKKILWGPWVRLDWKGGVFRNDVIIIVCSAQTHHCLGMGVTPKKNEISKIGHYMFWEV